MNKENRRFTPELNEQSINLEPKSTGFEIYDGTQPHKVNLDSLCQFEAASWPEEEMASRGDIAKRLETFPEGIAMLYDTDPLDGVVKPMAQFTQAPKMIPQEIEGFEQMRDLPVDTQSETLWGTNISRRIGEKYSGHGYASQLVSKRLIWAKEHGYKRFMGGVTCDGLAEYIEQYLDEHRKEAMEEIRKTGDANVSHLREKAFKSYFVNNMNPATKLFERIGRELELEVIIGEPIKDYWPINETSLGYGVMVEVILAEQTEENPETETELEFSFDLNKAQVLGSEIRETVDGTENTMFCYLPAEGCPNNCEFCSVKHIKADNYEPSIEQSVLAAEKIRKFLTDNPITDTIKIFNAGNILHGTEFGERCEMHEYLWDKLPEVLAELRQSGQSEISNVEIEVRIDEIDPESNAAHRNEVAERLQKLALDLEAIGISLRVLLALEYIDEDIIKEQAKFARPEDYQATVSRTLNHLANIEVDALAYAMFGGRKAERAMNGYEAITATYNTIDFALSQENAPREVIVNWQYLDPIQQKREAEEGSLLYMPTEADAGNLLLLLWPKLKDYSGRIRISYAPEDTIVGTRGAELSESFTELLDNFNNAPDQYGFLSQYFA